jgi:hypothetical protein
MAGLTALAHRIMFENKGPPLVFVAPEAFFILHQKTFSSRSSYIFAVQTVAI